MLVFYYESGVSSLIKISFDHLKRVGVGPEFLLWVKAVQHLPIYGQIFATEILSDVQSIKLNLKLNYLLKNSWRKSYLNKCLLLIPSTIENDGILIHILASLEPNILLRQRVSISKLI